MNKKTDIFLPALLLLAILSLFATSSAFAANGETKIDWNDDELNWLSYEEGMRQIEKTGKPGLLVIYADWCPACRDHSKDFFDKEVIACLQDMVLIRANKDTSEKISKKYDFDGEYIPRVIALDGKAEVLHKLYNTDKRFAYFNPTRSHSKFLRFLDKARKYDF